MLFLWVFGNAICSKLGNIIYLPLFVLCGLGAAASHLIINGNPALGSSGAIFGIVGMFLVLFPQNEVSCFIMWFSLANFSRIFTVSSYWVIVMWFLFSDILGAIFLDGITKVAYFAYLGGFASGFAIAILLLKMKRVKMETHERSLLQLLSLEKAPETTFGETNQEFWERQIAVVEAVTAENEANLVDRKVAEPEPIFIEPMVVEEFIRFYCSCGEKIKVPGIHAGISGKCPTCSAKFIVPRESQVEPSDKQEAGDLIRFACECGKKIKVPAKLAGKMGRCPACQAEVIIPEKPLA